MTDTDTHTRRTTVRVSAVIPCYNEEESIGELYRRVSAACLEEIGEDFEIVLVNDGSADSTWTKVSALAGEDHHVVGINLSRNHGHQLALSAGLSACRGDRILILDADLQDPPELLGKMMLLMDEGADVVYGRRAGRAGETWFKRATAAIFYSLLRRLVDVDIPRDAGDFRLLSRRALSILLAMPEQHRFLRGMVSWIGLRQVPVVYDRAPRYRGETKYSVTKMARFALDAITGFSTKPLRIASYLGLLFGLFGIALLVYVVVGFATLRVVPGWTSLMAVVSIMGSATLFVLGLIGEYIGRMYMEMKRRPLFIIDEVVGSEGLLETAPCPHCGQTLGREYDKATEATTLTVRRGRAGTAT